MSGYQCDGSVYPRAIETGTYEVEQQSRLLDQAYKRPKFYVCLRKRLFRSGIGESLMVETHLVSPNRGSCIDTCQWWTLSVT